jgi:beta-glucosidase
MLTAPTNVIENSPQLSAAANACFAADGFVFGAATSAYQIEGAANQGGRGASIWDTFCATPGKTRNGDSGQVACDHYHRYPDDVQLLHHLGVDAYRFSIAWPRVQPLGRGAWNAEGLDFYDRLTDALLAVGVAPHATLYHWDLPQLLQTSGGWAERDTSYRFADYAAEIGRRLGDRLASIATHNEPWCTAWLGHATGQFAPGHTDVAEAVQVSHHLLLSHGLALQALRSGGVKCPLGIVLNQSPASAATPSAADEEIAEREYARLVRWYLEPLLIGSYPTLAADLPAPIIAAEDMALIGAPLDFLGVNYYTRIWASSTGTAAPCELGRTDMGWEIYPRGLRDLLLGIDQAYRLPPIYIMENGIATLDSLQGEQVSDPDRIQFLQLHLEALAEARIAGVDVRGYFAWSLLDNFEWDSGYDKRFGLVHVDYATQKRTPKDSFYWLRQTIRSMRQGQGQHA